MLRVLSALKSTKTLFFTITKYICKVWVYICKTKGVKCKLVIDICKEQYYNKYQQELYTDSYCGEEKPWKIRLKELK